MTAHRRQSFVIASAGLLLVGGGGLAAASVKSGGDVDATCAPKSAVAGGRTTTSERHCFVPTAGATSATAADRTSTTATAADRTSTTARTAPASHRDRARATRDKREIRATRATPTSTRSLSPAGTASPTRTTGPIGGSTLFKSPPGERLPTTTPTGTRSGSPTSTATPTGSSSASPTPPPTSNPSTCTKPTAANTGATGSLTPYTGSGNITKAGSVIKNVTIHGDVTVNAPNVTIRNVRITGGGGLVVHNNGDGTTVDHVTSDDGIAISSAENVTIEASTVVAAKKDALHVTSDDGSHVTGAKILRNYLPAPSKALIGSDAHFDGLQVRGSDDMLIQCNNWQPGSFPTFGPKTDNVFNGDVFLENANGGNHNVTLDNNWMYDSGYSLRVQAITGAKITNNHFGGHPAYGFCVVRAGAQITKASGNVDDNTGKSVTISAGN